MKSRLAQRLTVLAATLGISSCATTVITPELEDQLGSYMAAEVAQQIGHYSDAELEQYLSRVGGRLVSELGDTPYTFRFTIIDQFEPNAFAAPGGFVYVSRGLLAQVNSEAELAGVLAHEISHVTRRHHAKQAGRSVRGSLYTLPGRAVGVLSEDLGNVINAPIERAGKVNMAAFSREQETEADRFGMDLAAKAGYEPTALARALNGIERAVEYLTGEQQEPDYLDTHPTTPQRVEDIQAHARGLVVAADRPPIANQAQFLQQLDGLWWGPQNPQQGVLVAQTYLNADLDLSITFPDEWQTTNTPSFVGAAQPDGEAYLALGHADHNASLLDLSEAVVRRMYDSAQITPAVQRDLTLSGWPARLLRYDDNSGEEPVSLYYLFVRASSQTYLLLAMGLEHHRDVLRNSALSLRTLQAGERDKVRGYRLRLASTSQDAPLQQFSREAGNVWSPAFTRIMNGLPDDADATAGTSLKITREEVYSPVP